MADPPAELTVCSKTDRARLVAVADAGYVQPAIVALLKIEAWDEVLQGLLRWPRDHSMGECVREIERLTGVRATGDWLKYESERKRQIEVWKKALGAGAPR